MTVSFGQNKGSPTVFKIACLKRYRTIFQTGGALDLKPSPLIGRILLLKHADKMDSVVKS
jgi:hypothetical protein